MALNLFAFMCLAWNKAWHKHGTLAQPQIIIATRKYQHAMEQQKRARSGLSGFERVSLTSVTLA